MKAFWLSVSLLLSMSFASNADAQIYRDGYYRDGPTRHYYHEPRRSDQVAGVVLGLAALVAADRYLDRKYDRRYYRSRSHHYHYPRTRHYSASYRDYRSYDYGHRRSYYYDRHVPRARHYRRW